MQVDGILSVCIPVILMIHGHRHINFLPIFWLIDIFAMDLASEKGR